MVTLKILKEGDKQYTHLIDILIVDIIILEICRLWRPIFLYDEQICPGGWDQLFYNVNCFQTLSTFSWNLFINYQALAIFTIMIALNKAPADNL